MTKHQKRLSVPDSWPVSRKSNTFTIKAGAGPHGQAGVPITIILRDVLGYADTKNEAQYALNQGTVKVNGHAVSDEGRPIGMFDILAFTGRNEYYRVFPDEGGRMTLTAISEEDAGSKLGKVIGKRHVDGGRTQLNLHDGGNLIVEDGDQYGGGDSVVVDNEDGSVVAHFPYEEGALVTAVRGSHAGEIGNIVEIDVTPGSGDNRVLFDVGEEVVETIADYIVVIDEQFAGDEAADDEAADDDTDEEVTDDE